MGYVIARRIFKALVSCLIVVAIPLSITLIQVLVAFPRDKFPDNLYSTILGWFFLPGASLTGTLSTASAFTFLLILTGTITKIGELRIGGSSAVLHKYLQSFIEDYKIDAPVGFYPSPLLNLTPLPLEEFAIDLMLFPLRARYDTPIISETLRNEINNQSNLQTLDLEPKQTCQSVFIKDILQNFNDKPVAMIWGTPGSGKSTTVYKLALDLARAILQPHKHHFPDGLPNMRIPILLPIRAYSKSLNTNSGLHFKDFFDIYLKEKYPEIPKLNAKILSKLSQGRCLIIFDGLDENSNDQNEYIIQEIHTFISNHLKKSKKFQNYFIITSRIANYNIGRMEEFLNHYTLLDLSKSQVDIFLKKHFACIERYIQKKKKFTDSSKSNTDLEAEAQEAGDKQSKHMLSIIDDSKGIKELQFHPLFLTTLIFMYITGLLLPNSRIDAYKIITNTLLDNWNKGSERNVLTQEEVYLANDLLAELASVLHEKPPILSQQDVYKIIRETKANLHHIRPEQISDIEIQRLIKKIRLNSGLLLVAGHNHGMDVFIFSYPCIQEYFMALHLLKKGPDELKNILLQHHNELDWHESLQLVIASKNNYHSPSEAIELIKTLFDAYKQQSNTSYNDFLFITSCMIDCGAWGPDDTNLRKSIANHLFEIYGSFENNSDQVHENIEKLTLLWLRCQYANNNPVQRPPMLTAWYEALCDTTTPTKQEGAVHLLTALIPEAFLSCPPIVIAVLFPPLLQLANLQDIIYPQTIQEYLPTPPAIPGTLRIRDYARIGIRFLYIHDHIKQLEDKITEWKGEIQ